MSKKFGTVALIQGGDSPERDISLDSSVMVGDALEKLCDKLIRFDPKSSNLTELVDLAPDAAFIILHGGSGEDGTIQAALKMLGIPHTGSDTHSCSIAMDKNLSKLMWVDAGLPTAPWLIVESSSDENLDEIQLQLGMDLFVKPNSGGSSIATYKTGNREELAAAINSCVTHEKRVMVEQAVDGMELTYGIVGEKLLPGIRIETAGELYDYQAKYISDETKFICPPGMPELVDEECGAIAKEAFQALGCSGWGRVDMMVSGREPYLLEVNTVPGMTSHSLLPHAAAKVGISELELITQILEQAK